MSDDRLDVIRLEKALRAADVLMGQRHDETFPLDLYDQAWTRYAEFIAREYAALTPADPSAE